MHLEIKQSTSGTETVSTQTIDKLYQLSYENQSQGITSQLDATSDIQGRIEASAAYEDAVRYLVGIDPGDPKRFQNLYINIPNNNYYVRFEDPVVRDYCLQQYGDGVGMTRTVLSGIVGRNMMWSSSGGMSSDLKSQVTSLNDFQYFTGIGPVNDDNIVVDFTNATSIKFPSCTFSYSNRYTRNIVYNCKKLQTIDYSNAVFTVGSGDGSMRPINVNETIQEWSSSLLPNQTDFRNIELFYAWKKLQKIIFPEGVTTTNESLRVCNSMQYLEYPSTITNIGNAYHFGRDSGHRVPCMVVKAISPPTWTGWNPNETGMSGHGFGYDQFPTAIYVPDNSVTAYKSVVNGGTNNESAWASPYVQALITPMSQMPQLYRDMGTVTQEDIDRI